MVKGPFRRAPRGGHTKSSDDIAPPNPSSWTICRGLGCWIWSILTIEEFLCLRLRATEAGWNADGVCREPTWFRRSCSSDICGISDVSSLTMNPLTLGNSGDDSRDFSGETGSSHCRINCSTFTLFSVLRGKPLFAMLLFKSIDTATPLLCIEGLLDPVCGPGLTG